MSNSSSLLGFPETYNQQPHLVQQRQSTGASAKRSFMSGDSGDLALQKQLDDANEHIQQILEQSNRALKLAAQHELQNHELEVNLSTEELTILQENVSELQSNLQYVRGQKDILIQQLADMNQEYNLMASHGKQLEAEIEAQQGERMQLREELAMSRTQYETAIDQVQLLQKSLDESEQQVAKQTAEIQQLERENEQLKKFERVAAQLKSQLHEEQAESYILQAENARMSRQLQELGDELSACQLEYDQLEDDYVRIRHECSALEASHHLAQEDAEQLTQELLLVKQQYEQVLAAKKREDTAPNTPRIVVSPSSTDSQRASANKAATAAAAAAAADYAVLLSELDRQPSDAQVDKFTSTTDELVQQHVQELEEKETERQQLQVEVARLQAELNRCHEECGMLQGRIDTMKGERQALEEQYDASVAATERDLNRYKGMLEESRKQVEELQHQLAELQEQPQPQPQPQRTSSASQLRGSAQTVLDKIPILNQNESVPLEKLISELDVSEVDGLDVIRILHTELVRFSQELVQSKTAWAESELQRNEQRITVRELQKQLESTEADFELLSQAHRFLQTQLQQARQHK